MQSALMGRLCALLGLVALGICARMGTAEGVSAQEGVAPQPLAIPAISGEITLDGIVDEAAWDALPPLPMTMYSPVFHGDMTQRTEIRVGHDDRYIYVSGKLFDTAPEAIQTNTFYRDQYSGDDAMAILFDSYNDYENAVWMVTNPAGARIDRTVSSDAEFTSGMPMNQDWNSYWDVETTRTDEGWFAEFRIPFSTLGFQVEEGAVTMGMIAYRIIPRNNERHLFPAMDPRWGGMAFAKPSRARRVVLEGVRQSTPVYVVPFTSAGFSQEPAQDLAGVWEAPRRRTLEAGGDIRFSPIPNLSLDVTVNTDFAQVEADEQQINLTRFSLFFPEKRQFFQERASTFSFGTGGMFNRLFHSRAIGLRDGSPVRIYGGARAVGRVGGLDFGLLTMQTAGEADAGSENMGVARLIQEVFNPYSSVGFMVTTRLSGTGANNVAYGMDGLFRVIGDEYLLLQWADTFDEGRAQTPGLASALLRARWERRREDGLTYFGEASRVGKDYLPGLGFQLRRDYVYGSGSLGYSWFMGDGSRIQSMGASVETRHFYRAEAGTAESRGIAPTFEMRMRSGARTSLGALTSFESVDEDFSISGFTIPKGEYWFTEANAEINLPRTDEFRGRYAASAGTFYGGSRQSISLQPTWSASKHVEVTPGYELNRLSRDSMRTTVHLASLKAQFSLNTKLSVSSLLQYDSAEGDTDMNMRFRYHFREGTDLWIVYNEGIRGDRDRFGPPRAPWSRGRTLQIKYARAFVG